jgi:hypothetical protein
MAKCEYIWTNLLFPYMQIVQGGSYMTGTDCV